MSPVTLQTAKHLRDADEVVATLRRTRRRKRRLAVYLTTDTAVLLLAALAATFGTTRYGDGLDNIGWGLGYVAITLITLELRGFYGFRLNSTPVDDLGRIIAATSIAAMITL